MGQMLKINTVLKELDVSGNHWTGGGPAFAKGIADGLDANRAMTSLNLSDNGLGGYYDDDNDNWISDMSGVTALAAAIPECR